MKNNTLRDDQIAAGKCYAVFFDGQYFGAINHEHRTLNIEEAQRFTKHEGLKFISKVIGAQLHLIK